MDAVVDIHVGVVGAGFVVHRVLDELEAGEADGVKGKVICAAGVADRNGPGAHVFEGFEPGFEDGAHHVVALQVDAADFAGAVVVVEIAGEFGVFSGELHGFGIAEVFLHVSARAEQAFFFTTPQRDADGAVEREVRGFESADGFDHDSAAGGVICCSGATVPGIEVRAEHDDFIFVLAGAGNFADDVEAIGICCRRYRYQC